MAKLTIFGAALQIKSELTGKDIERVSAFAPDALKLYDQDGNELFGVGVGDASVSKYGICFCSEDNEGKLFMTYENPICNHTDPEAERKAIIMKYAPIIHKLEAIEGKVDMARAALEEMEASVDSSVTFAQ